MKDCPTLSVVMTTCNGERYLREQLDSILSQTFPVYELIIRDDGSTDGTLALLESYAARFPFIRVYRNETNRGWNVNFRTVLRQATGALIAIADQDDVWYPQKLARQVAQLDDCSLCFSYRWKDPVYTEHGSVPGNPQPHFESLLFTSHIPGHSMLLRRSFLQKIDTWYDDIPYDWWLALQAHLHGGLTCVPEALNWHRPHADSASAILLSESRGAERRITWQPYVFGYRAFRRQQCRPDYQFLYKYIVRNARAREHRLPYRLATLLLSRRRLDVLRLCWLTMRNRQLVHAKFGGGRGVKRLVNAVRGFFYPLMWAYNRNASFLGK